MENVTTDLVGELDLGFLDLYDPMPHYVQGETDLYCYECSLCWQNMKPWELTTIPNVIGNVCIAYAVFGICLPSSIATGQPADYDITTSMVKTGPSPMLVPSKPPKPKKKKQKKLRGYNMNLTEKEIDEICEFYLQSKSLIATTYMFRQAHPEREQLLHKKTVWRHVNDRGLIHKPKNEKC